MTEYKAGERVAYRVTWLEMSARPSYGWPPAPSGRALSLLRAEAPPRWYFLALYDAVGADYEWTDQHRTPPDELTAWLRHPEVALYTLMGHGWPQGFFVLDGREEGICDLAYMGLVPQALGTGLGRWLLQTAVLTAWERPGVEKLTVNTCTLDHPRALGQYQRAGFAPVRTEDRSRVLSRDRSFSHPLL